MPVIKSAEKKLRQDKKRLRVNLLVKKEIRDAVNKFRKTPNVKLLSQAYSIIDRAAKKNIYHANKASRIKSNLTRWLEKKADQTAQIRKSKKKKNTATPKAP